MIYLIMFLILSTSVACDDTLKKVTDDSDSTVKHPTVMIESNKTRYDIDENIEITVRNKTEEPITSMDQQTFCSIILLEIQRDDNWEPLRNCTLNSPAREVTIDADSSETVQLEPSQQFAGSLPAGTYKATLVYSIGKTYIPDQNSKAYSDIFTVQ